MAGPLFAADPPAVYRIVELDGLSALFHRRSGLTHILAPPAPQILEALADEAGDADEILERISGRFDVEGEGADALTARLAELEAAGLVWRV